MHARSIRLNGKSSQELLERGIKNNGYFICMATHPRMPNFDGHSRRRTNHLTEDFLSTLCNMLPTKGYIPFEGNGYYEKNPKICKSCVAAIGKPRKQYAQAPKKYHPFQNLIDYYQVTKKV